jgi:hypothetical protein
MGGTEGSFVCGAEHAYQGELPDAGEGMCCMGAAVYGPHRCSCWMNVYDLEQQPLAVDDRFGVRSEPCGDCAYRAGSPEKRGEEFVVGDQDTLDELVATETPFWCHQGIRRVVALLHEPTGVRHSVPDDFAVAYSPPIRGNRPYKADGTPADLCAGWAARVAARRSTEDESESPFSVGGR